MSDRHQVKHWLKIWPEHFAAVSNGSKTFEVRIDDRGFAVGDVLHLSEYDPRTATYTGLAVLRRVTYLLRGPTLGVTAGHVVMSIVPLSPTDPAC